MSNIFFISDTHFRHHSVLKFVLHTPDCPFKNAKKDDPVECSCPKMRSFASVEEMDEFMIDQWNKTVKPSDKIYHLGDVAIKRKDIALVARCHGHKRLVRGNHDIYATKDYMKVFDEVYGSRVFEDMILTHIPIHHESIKARWTNVHGHTHNNQPRGHLGNKYLNVCVEYTEYRPLAVEEVRQRIKQQNAVWERCDSIAEFEQELLLSFNG